MRDRAAGDPSACPAGVLCGHEGALTEVRGLVGRTGAGKSSVLLAVFGMAPTEGRLLVGGVDVLRPDGGVTRALLRRRLGVIPQVSGRSETLARL